MTTYALATEILVENVWTPETVSRRQSRLLAVFSRYWKLSDDVNSDSNGTLAVSKEESAVSVAAINTEKFKQERLYKELDLYFAKNPGTKLPKLLNDNVKVGEFVRRAMHRLSLSEYVIPDVVLRRLCTIEGSKKYTRRNLPFLVKAEEADLKSDTMKRYWKKSSYVESFNGEQYYVYSQWYPDPKDSKDAHRSDFLQFYLDLANNAI